MDSFVSQGLPLDPDMFTTGETPHGCGHVPRSVYNGIRTTSGDFVTNGYHRNNVTIMTETTVDKILFKKTPSGPKADGVLVVTANGRRTLHAKREIIISSGSYCSPTILMRSGLGPKEELQKHNIECLFNLPGVGKNLMDHLVGALWQLHLYKCI